MCLSPSMLTRAPSTRWSDRDQTRCNSTSEQTSSMYVDRILPYTLLSFSSTGIIWEFAAISLYALCKRYQISSAFAVALLADELWCDGGALLPAESAAPGTFRRWPQGHCKFCELVWRKTWWAGERWRWRRPIFYSQPNNRSVQRCSVVIAFAFRLWRISSLRETR